MAKKNERKGKRKKNLEGYKQEGKRFIPPLKQLPNLREQSYVNDMLPQLAWLALIHDRAGYRAGAQVLEAVVDETKSLPTGESSLNYATQAAYAETPADVKSAIVRNWEQRGLLTMVRDAIAPLILLYDECPLAFAGPPEDALPQEVLLRRISETVGRHLDRNETPGTILHGTLLLTRLMAGTVKFSQQIEVPDFNAVIDDPRSDEARRAASFMRASAGAEWGFMAIPNNWARHFWNRNAELSPCVLPRYVDND